jgi:hypothetical protein
MVAFNQAEGMANSALELGLEDARGRTKRGGKWVAEKTGIAHKD